VAELRQLMAQVDDIKKRRDGIETQLKDVHCDMSKSSLQLPFVKNVDCFVM